MSHLLDNGSQPSKSKSLAVRTGDDGGAHLDDHPLGLLQLGTSQEGSAATAVVLLVVTLEDRLAQRCWRDVRVAPGKRF